MVVGGERQAAPVDLRAARAVPMTAAIMVVTAERAPLVRNALQDALLFLPGQSRRKAAGAAGVAAVTILGFPQGLRFGELHLDDAGCRETELG